MKVAINTEPSLFISVIVGKNRDHNFKDKLYSLIKEAAKELKIIAYIRPIERITMRGLREALEITFTVDPDNTYVNLRDFEADVMTICEYILEDTGHMYLHLCLFNSSSRGNEIIKIYRETDEKKGNSWFR